MRLHFVSIFELSTKITLKKQGTATMVYIQAIYKQLNVETQNDIKVKTNFREKAISSYSFKLLMNFKLT